MCLFSYLLCILCNERTLTGLPRVAEGCDSPIIRYWYLRVVQLSARFSRRRRETSQRRAFENTTQARRTSVVAFGVGCRARGRRASSPRAWRADGDGGVPATRVRPRATRVRDAGAASFVLDETSGDRARAERALPSEPPPGIPRATPRTSFVPPRASRWGARARALVLALLGVRGRRLARAPRPIIPARPPR